MPETFDALEPDVVPVIPVTDGADHVYVVPAGTMFPEPFAGATVNVEPEQIVAVCATTLGIGLTVTAKLKEVPEHKTWETFVLNTKSQELSWF